jgi:hypothetical protein
LFANKALCQLYRKPKEEVVGRTVREIWGDTHPEAFYQFFEEDDCKVLEDAHTTFYQDQCIKCEPNQCFRALQMPYKTITGEKVRMELVPLQELHSGTDENNGSRCLFARLRLHILDVTGSLSV